MTQIFFYHNAGDRVAAAAALIGKAFLQKKAMLVYAPDAEVANALDRELWMQPATGFIPHVRSDSPLAPQTPVLIAGEISALEAPPQCDRLLNLADAVPPGFSRFTSLIEVVGQEAGQRLAGRERVRFYKDRGYAVSFFDLAEPA